MYTKLCRALILTFCISSGLITSSTKLTHITQKSHPMLASLFNVANNIRRFDGKAGDQINGRGIVSNGNEKISMASVNHGVKKQPDIVNFAKQVVPSKEIPKSLHRNIHAEKIAGLENTMIRNQEVLQVADIQSRSEGKPTFPLLKEAIILDSSRSANLQDFRNLNPLTEPSSGGITADIMCSLCHREGNETCIAIHCWNNEIEKQISELSPLTLQSAGAPIVSLSENFDFRNQIDRHDLLQLTTKNAALDQNINRGHLDLQSRQTRVRIPGNTNGKNMAPIWPISDSIQDKASKSSTPLTTQPLWPLTDRRNMVPNFQPQKTVPLGNGGSRVNANDLHLVNKRPVAVQQPRHGMSFVTGNVDTTVSNAQQRPGLRDVAPPMSEPIGISTDILRQLVRLEAASDHTSNQNIHRNFPSTHTDRMTVFSPSGNANNINSEISNGIQLTAEASGIDLSANHGNNENRFPDGFVEGPSNMHRNDINPGGSVPQIPLASDVFSSSTNVDNTNTRHTLVIKDHGNTEVVGVHVGNGPILRSGVRPLEMSGQNVVRQPQNNRPEHTHAGDGHSHQNPQNHHSPIISNQLNHHEHSTETNGFGHEHHGMENTDHHAIAALTGSTTTVMPTMDPGRRASLQNWSSELLQGFRL